MKSKRIYKSCKSRSRKLRRTKRNQHRKQLKKQIGGNPMTHIDSGIEGLTIEYFNGSDGTYKSVYKGANDLADYLNSLTIEPKYDYVYVSIGSKTPPYSSASSTGKMVAGIYEPADTNNADYQKIPALFEAPSDNVKNIFIIMIEEFRELSEYHTEAEQIKRRYGEIKAIRPDITIHAIMCHLQFVPNGNDPSVRENFVNTMTAYANVLNAITRFSFEIQQLEQTRFLICNYIRFKHGNLGDDMLFYMSNCMISWVLGGEPFMQKYINKPNGVTEKQSIKFTDYIGVDEIGITRVDRGMRTDCHYIWAGYDFVNLIYKYTDYNKITSIIHGFLMYPIPQIPGRIAVSAQEVLREFTNIHFSDYELCSKIPEVYLPNPKLLQKKEVVHHLHKLFRPHTTKPYLSSEEIEENFRMIDFTINYDEYLRGNGYDLYNVNELPNICEN